MHELSIAQSLIELASEAAAREGADRVVRLSARIGRLSGVVRECLQFSFDLAAEDTPCAGAALDIEEVDVTAMCPACAAPQHLDLAGVNDFRCPRCGSPMSDILSGRELELVSVEIAEHETANR